MLDKILVPLDGSSLAQCALPHALAVARACGSEIIFLHVQEQSANDGEQVDPLDWHLRKAEAEAYLNNVSRQWAAGIRGSRVLLEGPAAERIVEFADAREVDLIVLSSHGSSGLSEWNVSSVVQKIILRARRSVMIVPAYQEATLAEGRPAGYQRIMVPLDGSRRAESVLPLVSLLATANEAEVVLAHVVGRPPLLLRQPPTSEEEQLVSALTERNRNEAQRYLEEMRGRLDVPAEVRLLVAEDVPSRLHRLAEEEQVSLVVLSAHGYTGTHRPYGSITSSFINYGAGPLLILQDMPHEEIEPSKAEITVKSHTTGGTFRAVTYAQPAFWSIR